MQSPGAKVMNKSDEFVAHVVAPPCAGTAALTNSSAVKIFSIFEISLLDLG